MSLHRIYFSPGMFGFGRLAQVDYFKHWEKAMGARFRARGLECVTYVSDVAPTASIRRRAATLAELIARTSSDDVDDSGPIHIIGHSTGGLDARLIASPSATLPVPKESLAWLSRLETVTTLNTPHYGTPLASFFATVSGQRILYALSAMTVIALSLGGPPLAAAGALVMALGRIDRMLGVKLRVLDSATDRLLSVLEPEKTREVIRYLAEIKSDQGAMVQLMPEAMDLFHAGIEDRPGVRYQSAASMASPPSPSTVGRALMHPWSVLSGAIFAAIYGITSRSDARYPCAADQKDEAVETAFLKAFGHSPTVRANDGVVPIRSQIWGELVWLGLGDHLDMLGHFWGEKGDGHVDWLTSGSGFDISRFDSLTETIAEGLFRGRVTA